MANDKFVVWKTTDVWFCINASIITVSCRLSCDFYGARRTVELFYTAILFSWEFTVEGYPRNVQFSRKHNSDTENRIENEMQTSIGVEEYITLFYHF